MNTRCKVGDAAYIIRATIESNIGRVVEVVRQDMSIGLTDLNPGEVRWECKILSDGVARSRTTGFLVPVKAGETTSTPDSWLRPISGVPVDDEVTEDLKVPA
jgi:hypothetical protein